MTPRPPLPGGPHTEHGQSGLSLMELVMCLGIGALLIASGSFLFIGQVKGYKDIGSQARLQTMTKKAVQAMNTEIANTGASLSNRRLNFLNTATKFQFSYVDLKSRHCASSDTVTVAYYTKSGGTKGDTLLTQVKCNSKTPTTTPLVKGLGTITLKFTYYDINGVLVPGTTAADKAKIKAVEFNLLVKSLAGKSLFVPGRNPKIRVDLLN
jgi:Tfp pilus assembly protein PilW